MSNVINFSEFRAAKNKCEDNAIAESDRKMLRTEFDKAATCLWLFDQEYVSKKDYFQQECIVYRNAQIVVDHVLTICPALDTHTVELEIITHLSMMVKQASEDIKHGVARTIVRREWERAVDKLLDRATEAGLPSIQAARPIRNASPDPQNA